MKIEKRDVNGVTILDIKGNIKLGESTQQFERQVQECVEQGSRHLLVNLGGVKFMDSAGLGVLIGGYNTIVNGGGALKLLNVTKRVDQLLIITKLATVMDCFDDEGAALASFDDAAPSR